MKMEKYQLWCIDIGVVKKEVYSCEYAKQSSLLHSVLVKDFIYLLLKRGREGEK